MGTRKKYSTETAKQADGIRKNCGQDVTAISTFFKYVKTHFDQKTILLLNSTQPVD
jgi:hypothetical protein